MRLFLLGLFVFLQTLVSGQYLINSHRYNVADRLVIGGEIRTFTAAQAEASNVQPSSLYNPMSFYHNARTYIPYMRAHISPYNQGLSIMTYDAGYGALRPYEIGPSNLSGDTHSLPNIILADNDYFYVTQERPHNSPVRIYKSRNIFDVSSWEQLTETIGDKIGYSSITTLPSGNHTLWHRYAESTLAYYASLYVSSSGMETWGSRLDVTESSGSAFRWYTSLPFRNVANGWIYYEVTERIEIVTTWRRKHILKTPANGSESHVVFYNLQETFSKNVVADGPLTATELRNNYMYIDTGDDNNQGYIPYSCVSPSGNFYSVGANSSGTPVFIYWNGSAWATKTISISNLVTGGDIGMDSQVGPFAGLISYSDVKHEIFVKRTVNVGGTDYSHMFIYRTVDQGTTWEEVGDLTPALTKDVYLMSFPKNFDQIGINSNFAVALFTADANPTDVTLVKLAFGATTTDSDVLSTSPASSLSSIAGLSRHYKISAATVNKTGTTLNSLIDQSGNGQNATTAGSPVLNDGTTPTSVRLDGSNDEISVPTTSINSVGKLTLMAVIRKQSGDTNDPAHVMTAANTSVSTRYIICMLNKNAGYNSSIVASTRNGEGTGQDYWGNENSISTNYVIATWVIDGSNIQMYLNGRKQYFHANSAEARQLTGRCFDDITSGISNIIIGALKRNTNSYAAFDLKEWALWADKCLTETERRQGEARLAADHSITLSDEYQ
jgi:hypothetical protein